MRKILSVIFSLLLICSLAVSASAAEGFIYCEAQNLITVELNDQHLALGELSQKTGVQFEMYFMTCTDEPIPMDALGEVLYENKEQQPEEYVAVLLQVGQDETGWYLDETYPWDMIAKGSIAQDTAFMSALEVILDSLITTDNWSGPLAEDQMVATLTATALVEAADQLLAEQSAPATPYVIDDARLLTIEQRQELNAYAEKITETYGMGIYIMSVEDFHNYGEEPQIFDVLWNYYHDNSLGYGADRQGMILMLSIAERDFATFFYGEDTEYAFNGFGQAQLENYFLDDGAYLAVKIVIKAARLKKEGQTLDSVIAELQEPADEKEIRIPIVCSDFGPYGDKLLEDLAEFVKASDGLSLEEPNYEGVRINFPDGWCLLRKSLHDPILPMNMASDKSGGCAEIKAVMAEFLAGYDQLDLSVME